MKKKIFLVLIVVLTLSFALVGCTPSARLSDIYVNHAELTEFDGARLEGDIPEGYNIAYGFNTANPKESPFFASHKWVVIRLGNDNKKLAVYDYNSKSYVVGSATVHCYDIKKNENFIIYHETASSDIMLRDCKSSNVVNLKEHGVTNFDSIRIPSMSSKVFISSNSNYIKFYDVEGHIFQVKNRINGNSYCPEIIVYDNYVVQLNSIQNPSLVAIYEIPSNRYGYNEMAETKPLKESIFSSANVFVSYMGEGKFYIFMQDIENSDNYQYVDANNQKYKGRVKIFDAKADKIVKDYTDNKYYKTILSNKSELLNNDFGDLQISITDVLNNGYKFAEGISINPTTKVAEFDQFILNDKGEILVSLTGRFGSDIKLNKDRIAGISPLMLLFIDGKGFSPNTNLGSIRVLNIDGTTAFEKQDGLYQSLFYNNDALVCKKAVDFKGTVAEQGRYGAFDSNGKQIIDFKYDYMTPFIDGYSLAYNEFLVEKIDGKDVVTDVKINDIYSKDGRWHKPDGTLLPKDFNPRTANRNTKVYRVDKLGNEVEIKDIAHTRTNKLVFKVGAYVSTNLDGKYNVKNIKGDKIFDENFDEVFKDVVIDRPNLDEVTICGTRGNKVYIYTLTSSTRGIPEARTINDVIVPSVIVGSILLASIMIIAVIKIKSIKPVNANATSVENNDKKSKNK